MNFLSFRQAKTTNLKPVNAQEQLKVASSQAVPNANWRLR